MLLHPPSSPACLCWRPWGSGCRCPMSWLSPRLTDVRFPIVNIDTPWSRHVAPRVTWVSATVTWSVCPAAGWCRSTTTTPGTETQRSSSWCWWSMILTAFLLTGPWNQRNQTTCVKLRSKSSPILHWLPSVVRRTFMRRENCIVCHYFFTFIENPLSSLTLLVKMTFLHPTPPSIWMRMKRLETASSQRFVFYVRTRSGKVIFLQSTGMMGWVIPRGFQTPDPVNDYLELSLESDTWACDHYRYNIYNIKKQNF